MITGYNDLSTEQKQAAIQRLTALWAFTESGLGGIMHALQIPFTGLVVGGMAVIIICLTADLSKHQLKQVLKSALVVLIVKAMVSPHTPFPAYIAVSFQALLGYLLFSFLPVNFFSILLLSSIAMLESALQKLLVLTLLFGKSFWKAMDEMLAFIAKQFGIAATNGSQWIVISYLLIYITGGVFIAWIAWKTIRGFFANKGIPVLDTALIDQHADLPVAQKKKRSVYRKLWVLILVLIGLSVILYVFAADSKQGWLAVVRTVSWTLAAILGWYMIVSPLFTKLIQKLLQQKQSRYSDEVLKTLSFLPLMRRIAGIAWQQSRNLSGPARWQFFFTALIHWSLTATDIPEKR